jgi:flagellar biosynthesis anti-sigma factor FlgM
MKAIISSHSALKAYQRPRAVDPVSAQESPAPRESTVSTTGIRPAPISAEPEAEPEALAEDDASVDRAKVERLRQSLQSGSLKFDSQAIAQRLVDKDE